MRYSLGRLPEVVGLADSAHQPALPPLGEVQPAVLAVEPVAQQQPQQPQQDREVGERSWAVVSIGTLVSVDRD